MKKQLLLMALVNEFQWRRHQVPDAEMKEVFTVIIDFLLKLAEEKK